MPVAEKLLLPEGYGDTTEMLSRESVRAQLAEAKQYWLATNRGDGSPHVVPLDGLWVDDVVLRWQPENHSCSDGSDESERDNALGGSVEGRGSGG